MSIIRSEEEKRWSYNHLNDCIRAFEKNELPAKKIATDERSASDIVQEILATTSLLTDDG